METFHIIVSPPKQFWADYFRPLMPQLCKTLEKRGRVLYHEEKESHGHIGLFDTDARCDNLKRTVMNVFTKFVKNQKGLGDDGKKCLSITFKVKKHNDPLLLMGYIIKDVPEERRWKLFGEWEQKEWRLKFSDEELERAFEYYMEGSRKNTIHGWKCKSINSVMDFAMEWVKEQNIQWKWMNMGQTRHKQYPDWDVVIKRLHTLKLIPTSLACKVLKPQMRGLWDDMWCEIDIEELISYDRENE